MDKHERLEDLGGGATAQTLTEAVHSPGGRIGPYRLTHLLGRGGVGTVFLAVRVDGEFEQRVAVKLLNPASAGAEARRRLRVERQILAALDHPNIARLLDGGTTDDGLPYLVMEYIQGLRIDRYCNRSGLPIRQRLELFQTVCGAVEFAHRNLIVHRDLKPANILVTGNGTPKLLDFGIAKLLNPELATSNLAPTAPLLRLMTPAYATPEQVKAEPITTATDVYALGGVLYLLLTGHTPIVTAGRSTAEVVRAICQEDPRLPSVAALAAANRPGKARQPMLVKATAGAKNDREILAKRLRGDLDAIILKAMRKHPGERYPTVEQLTLEIDRHLSGVPVRARKATFGYRMRKLLTRHPFGVAATALFVVLCLGFGTVMGVQRSEVARARDQAESERAESEEVKEYLVGLFETASPWLTELDGQHLSFREVIDLASDSLMLQLTEASESRAELELVVGRIYRHLAGFDRSALYLESSLSIRRDLLGPDHPAVAESLHEIGLLRRDQGDYREAQAKLSEAVELRRRLFGSRSPEAGTSLHALGVVCYLAGDHRQAEKLLRTAVEIFQEDAISSPRSLAEAWNDLAAVLLKAGDSEQAEALWREALSTRRLILGSRHLEVAETLNNLGVLSRKEGRLEEAEEFLSEARDIYRARLGDAHPETARVSSNLARLYSELGKLEEASTIYSATLAAFREALPPDHPHLARALRNLATVLGLTGNYRHSIPLLQESLEIERGRDDRSSDAAFKAEERLAGALLAAGAYPRAAGHFRHLIEVLEDAGADRSELAAHIVNLALALQEGGDDASALTQYERALWIQREALGEGSEEVAETLRRLASLYRDRGDFALAAETLGLAIELSTVDENQPLMGSLLSSLSELDRWKGDGASAVTHAREALAILSGVLDAEDPRVLRTRLVLASALRAHGDLEEARSEGIRARDAARAALGDRHPYVALALVQLALIQLERGSSDGAERDIEDALGILRRSYLSGHWHIAYAESVLGACLASSGRADEAKELLTAAQATLRLRPGRYSPYWIDVGQRLAALQKHRSLSATSLESKLDDPPLR